MNIDFLLERLIYERDELRDKFDSLQKFISEKFYNDEKDTTSVFDVQFTDKCKRLTDVEQMYLIEQRYAMYMYLETLHMRIAYYKEKKAKQHEC